MALNAGDTEEENSVTLDAGSNTVSAGQAVKFDTNGKITPTTSNSDDYVGVVQEGQAGTHWTVHTCGLVVNVTVDGPVSAGDTLVPSGTTDGEWVTHSAGMYVVNSDTGASDVAANHPFVLEDGSNGDTVRAVFR